MTDNFLRSIPTKEEMLYGLLNRELKNILLPANETKRFVVGVGKEGFYIENNDVKTTVTPNGFIKKDNIK